MTPWSSDEHCSGDSQMSSGAKGVYYKQRKEESFNIDEFTIKDVDISEEQKYDSPAPDVQVDKRHTFTTHASSSTASWGNNPQLAVINDQDYVYQSLVSNKKQEDDTDIDFDGIEVFDSPDSGASSSTPLRQYFSGELTTIVNNHADFAQADENGLLVALLPYCAHVMGHSFAYRDNAMEVQTNIYCILLALSGKRILNKHGYKIENEYYYQIDDLTPAGIIENLKEAS
ncbi:unnamed protein product, partial [Didymodactylos carnosus]